MDRGKRSILQASTILALPMAALVAFAAHGAQPSRKATVKKSSPPANIPIAQAQHVNATAQPTLVAKPAAHVQHAAPTKAASSGVLNGLINPAPKNKPIPAAVPPTNRTQVKRTGGLLSAFAGALKPKKAEVATKANNAPKKEPNWDGIPFHKPTRHTANNTEAPIRDVAPDHETLAPAPAPMPPASSPPTIVRRTPAASLQAHPASTRLPGGNSILVREESVPSPSDLPKLPPPSITTPAQAAPSITQSSRRVKPAPVASPSVAAQAPSILSRNASSRRTGRQSHRQPRDCRGLLCRLKRRRRLWH